MKKYKKIFIPTLLLLLLYVIYHLAVYGIQWQRCIYTYNDVNTIENTHYILDKVAYTIEQKNSDCHPLLKEVTTKIISPQSYEVMRGETSGMLEKGKKFELYRTISRTAHGLLTVDSGSLPQTYLILKDEQGKLYRVAAAFLRKNEIELREIK